MWSKLSEFSGLRPNARIQGLGVFTVQVPYQPILKFFRVLDIKGLPTFTIHQPCGSLMVSVI